MTDPVRLSGMGPSVVPTEPSYEEAIAILEVIVGGNQNSHSLLQLGYKAEHIGFLESKGIIPCGGIVMGYNEKRASRILQKLKSEPEYWNTAKS
jgi:hypothetical protein